MNKKWKDIPYLAVWRKDLCNGICKGHLQEPYNAIFYNGKGSFKLNQVRYEEVESKQLATKIWSMANDWESLFIAQKIPDS